MTALDFGSIDKPASGSQLFTVAPTGNTQTTSGTGSFIGASVSGSVNITGSAGSQASVVAAPVGCSVAGVTLTAVTLSVSSPVTLQALATGVGGTIDVASNAADGATTCSYTITANYI